VVAVSQANANSVVRFDPNPTIPAGTVSYYYAHIAVDPENNRIYVMDAGQDTASAINFSNSKMSLAWQVKEQSNSYITLIGPANQRVFVETNQSPTITNPLQMNSGPQGANYREQIQWRDAQTGKLLAASAFYAPAAQEATVPAGYGGVIYDILNNGHIVALYPEPQS
jgi:DNA-binding beta-propeller fold protein YncE